MVLKPILPHIDPQHYVDQDPDSKLTSRRPRHNFEAPDPAAHPGHLRRGLRLREGGRQEVDGAVVVAGGVLGLGPNVLRHLPTEFMRKGYLIEIGQR